MESTLRIKNRINSIAATRQITQSMRLVSTVRMRAVRERMLANATFLDETMRMTREAALEPDVFDHPYVRGIKAYNPGADSDNPSEEDDRRGKNTDERRKCIVVIGADRGLCGGYNINVCRTARALIRRFGEVKLITVGQKIKDFFTRQNYGGVDIVKTYTGISETPFFEDAEEIANASLGLYNRGAADSIYIVYTRFVNMLVHIPTQTLILPLGAAPETGGGDGGDGGDGGVGRDSGSGDSIGVRNGIVGDSGREDGEGSGARRVKALIRYEPGCADFLTQSTPFYIASALFGAILESSVCEQCSRTVSMDTAVKNSDDMINALTHKYNKARQNAITAELADIIGGTKALQQRK